VSVVRFRLWAPLQLKRQRNAGVLLSGLFTLYF